MRLSANKKTILIIIAGLLLVLSLNFFQKEVRGFFYSFSSPIQKSFWGAGSGVSGFFESIFNAGNFRKENKELNFRIQELLYLQNSLNELKEENETLREALGLGLSEEFRLELAEITGKEADRDVILINKGSEDGILRDLLVVTSQKVLVGRVAEVYKNNSKVLLISDKESQLEAEISGRKVHGLLKGLGSSGVILDLIPAEEKIEEGDLVVSGDFLIGLVKKVKKIDVSPFQQAEVSAFLNISDLEKLFIVLAF